MPSPEILPKYRVGPGEEIPEWMANEAHLINEALDKGTINQYEAEHGIVEDKEVLDVMRSLVNVTYFVEYPPENVDPKDRGAVLLDLFSKRDLYHNGETISLADYLAENGQAVSIAMITLDDKTAEAVRYLNQKGVPVIGWVVVEDSEGYWTNRSNMTETIAKTQAVKQWAKENDLDLIALGFDIEKPIGYLRELARLAEFTNANPLRLLKEIGAYRMKRLKERIVHGSPQSRYQTELLDRAQAEGFETDVYIFPRFLKHISGDMRVPKRADRKVEMTYSSVAPPPIAKDGRTLKYTLTSSAVPGLGIVSGKEGETPGRDLTGKLPRHLTLKELETDIRAVLDQRIDLAGREFRLRDLYLFALNDARVAVMMNTALENAFDSMAGK